MIKIMIREVISSTSFYLCQGGNWQVVVEADSIECAATKAIEKIMLETQDDKKISLSVAIHVLELNSDLVFNSSQKEVHVFYAPLILANAGFHNEAQKLLNHLEELDREDEENEQ
jgi:hypothetical protein